MKIKKKVAIIDFGMGNIKSVENILNYFDVKILIIKKPVEYKSITHLILPGVGAFNKAMKNLKKNNLDKFLKEIKNKTNIKFLGICIGMQLMCASSSENGLSHGLNFFNLKVNKFKEKKNFKIPHVGFNNVSFNSNSKLFKNIKNNSDFYFDHGYKVEYKKNQNISSISYHSEKFISTIENENLYCTQFHPEKSQSNGLHLIYNFLNL